MDSTVVWGSFSPEQYRVARTRRNGGDEQMRTASCNDAVSDANRNRQDKGQIVRDISPTLIVPAPGAVLYGRKKGKVNEVEFPVNAAGQGL